MTFGPAAIMVDFATDTFPSHGIRVVKDGTTIATEDVMDASCVGVLGATGATEMVDRLSAASNVGSLRNPRRNTSRPACDRVSEREGGASSVTSAAARRTTSPNSPCRRRTGTRGWMARGAAGEARCRACYSVGSGSPNGGYSR